MPPPSGGLFDRQGTVENESLGLLHRIRSTLEDRFKLDRDGVVELIGIDDLMDEADALGNRGWERLSGCEEPSCVAGTDLGDDEA